MSPLKNKLTNKEWVVANRPDVPADFAAAVGGHPVVAETLWKRGVRTPDAARAFMDWREYTPAAPEELPDMDRAVSRLQRAIEGGEQICVWGDFDVDGQTSTALLVSALGALGAQVTSYVPKRLEEGHGVHLTSLAQVIDNGAQVILTCDTGIDEHEAVDYANSRGVDVIITDHHKLPKTLPDAAASVNARRVEPGHPLRDLPGVGVAYQLILALAPERDWTHLLDLVALGIVADVAPQRKDTRYWLQRGLAVLANTERVGLQVMMELAEVNPADVNEDDIGFRLAPRLNAIGRLGDANPTTELLTTSDLERARIIANQLEGLNAERRRLSDAVWQGVKATLERKPGLLRHAALVVGHPDWHTGVVGIVANRCVEQFHRPALLLKMPETGVAKGSARSIDGVDITDAIADNADLLEGYGGHTMAAGLALDAANVDAFRRGLSASVRAQLADVDQTPTLAVDRTVRLDALSLDFVRDVARIAPFGAGNPPLVLATEGVTIKQSRQLGRGAKHQKMTVVDDVGTERTVIWWDADELPTGRFDLAYTVRENTFRGEREVLIEWLDARVSHDEGADAAEQRQIDWRDYRQSPDPAAVLRRVRDDEGEELVVWGEVVTDDAPEAAGRGLLVPGAALLVWTVPPGGEVWQAALDAVQPERVYLVGVNPTMDTPERFLARLAGLVKYALQAKSGVALVSALAQSTAQREQTVRAGLACLAARGQVTVQDAGEGRVTFAKGDGTTDAEAVKEADARLKQMLQESEAYRRHWRRVAVERLQN